MRGLSIVLLSLVALTAPGCLSSENGLCSPDEKEAIFEPDLVGEWDAPKDAFGEKEEGGYFKVERDDPASKAYRITLYGKDGKQDRQAGLQDHGQSIQAYLVRLGDSLFLDVLMPRDENQPKTMPPIAHFFYLVEPKKTEVGLRMPNVHFTEAHPELLPCIGTLEVPDWKLKSYDLRLMFDAKDAGGLPKEGRSLIAVACGGRLPHVRIIDEAGKIVMSLDLARLKVQEGPIEKLRRQLEDLRPPHDVTQAEKTEIIAQIFSINLNGGPSRILATSQELREFFEKHAKDDAMWKGSRELVMRRR
jgi:hypothetical protein